MFNVRSRRFVFSGSCLCVLVAVGFMDLWTRGSWIRYSQVLEYMDRFICMGM